jgi:EAL domain-containing protein (putative c-di-GMP-specific phosphodiesterase class I)/DNA-binding NarL/FixJ family response regulator
MSAKILIVDDIAVNRMMIKLALKEEGYTFIEAENGKEGIEKVLSESPDIVLMDAMMPVMDGFEATQQIRKIDQVQRTPILMITSLESKEDKIKALECGVNDFINKSFDKLELKARCKSYIETAKLNKRYILASINASSGYPNKLALMKDIQQFRMKKPGLFLVYMDNYTLNESFFGNKIAEKLDSIFLNALKQFSALLPEHSIYHISNGEYAILVDVENFENRRIEAFCTNLIEYVKKSRFTFDIYEFYVNVTMSYANTDPETLYEDAHTILGAALQEKKEYLLSEGMIHKLKENIEENLKILKVIKEALKDDKIVPFFQPIYNNKTGEIKRYEALVRMYDEKYDLVFPQPYFLEAAKKGKLYPYITKLLIDKVMQKIRENGCEISINLSSLDIEDPVMREFLLEALENNKDVTDKLIFELLEDKETDSYEVVKNFIQLAKSYGVKIAIDDFGSGFSNFIRIIEFQPDIIKLDGSLIIDIARSNACRQTVETIKIFADKIGAKTVAEYVSDKEIFDIINEIGIDYSQGFYIGKAELELAKKPLNIKEALSA